MQEELEQSDKQIGNSNKPWLWKKGQSGNIMGRPKGKTMKEYAREYLERMTNEERDEWLEGIEKHKIWEMSEGKAESKTDLTSKGEKIVFMPREILDKYNLNESNPRTDKDNEIK